VQESSSEDSVDVKRFVSGTDCSDLWAHCGVVFHSTPLLTCSAGVSVKW